MFGLVHEICLTLEQLVGILRISSAEMYLPAFLPYKSSPVWKLLSRPCMSSWCGDCGLISRLSHIATNINFSTKWYQYVHVNIEHLAILNFDRVLSVTGLYYFGHYRVNLTI